MATQFVFPHPPGVGFRFKKFATHVVLFGQDKWIMKNIENAYQHVDQIYIAYSEYPWTYNTQAIKHYRNTFDLDIIRNSPFMDKITIIEGVWKTEEDQRNACADRAAKDGMDYLIIHDADEFYFHAEFMKIMKEIAEHPNYDFYKVGWYCFWKTFDYILLGSSGEEIVGYPEFAINLKRGVRFASKRRPNKNDVYVIPPAIGVCYHGSYVLTNEELLTKINTWGHAHQMNPTEWYNNVWVKWNENSVNLHPINPPAWSKTKRVEFILPEVLKK
ncbi:MAG: hypothetical protein HC836_28045 [Richelia sp. RM2_1_2]|nr:hypothetical protein [Richelia sp. RM2_1_2]